MLEQGEGGTMLEHVGWGEGGSEWADRILGGLIKRLCVPDSCHMVSLDLRPLVRA